MTDWEQFLNIFGAGVYQNVQKYLGLLTFVGRNKWEAFRYIKERIAKATKTWFVKSLSRVGKEIMIKGAGQANPIYVMGVFHIPVKMCREMETILNKKNWNLGQSKA